MTFIHALFTLVVYLYTCCDTTMPFIHFHTYCDITLHHIVILWSIIFVIMSFQYIRIIINKYRRRTRAWSWLLLIILLSFLLWNNTATTDTPMIMITVMVMIIVMYATHTCCCYLTQMANDRSDCYSIVIVASVRDKMYECMHIW